MSDPPLVEMISEDPVLRNTKLISEAWDCDGLFQVTGSLSIITLCRDRPFTEQGFASLRCKIPAGISCAGIEETVEIWVD